MVVASAASVYPSKIVSDGATVYFRMEEPNGTAAGSLGSSALGGSYVNASTRAGQAGALVGSADTSASFDGVSSFLRTEVSTPAPSVYSIETWFKTTSTTGGKLVGYGNRAMMNAGANVPLSSNFDRQVYLTNDGKAVFGVNSGGLQTIASAAGLNDGQWHQVVATQGPAGMALFVDGLRVGKNAVTGAQAYSGFWRIGGDNLAGWPLRPTSNYFSGNIDETAIYDKPLTSAQVADHFRLSGRSNPAIPAPPTDSYGAAVYGDSPDLYWRLGEASGTGAVDASGNNSAGLYAASVTRGVPSAVAGTTDTAISTNGAATGIVSSAVGVGAPAAFSEELWFKTASTTGGKLIGFGNSQAGASTSYDKHVYLGTDGKLRFGVNSGGLQVITSPLAYNNNAWHHVVATQDGSGTKLYVDGVLVVSGTATTNQSFTGFWRVGGDNLSGWASRPTTDYLTGSIDEVAVYTRALTATQVQTHYALGTNSAGADTQPPTAPTGLAATVLNQDVTLNWTASTDNVGVAGYEVHRSATSDFTPSAATKIATVTNGTSFTDPAVTGGTWFYKVLGVDVAGNTSPASTQAQAVVAAPADSQPPTAPAGLTTAVSGSTVALTWTPSTDNVGVAGYDVHRSATSGFTPSAATKIGTVTSGTTYSDSARPVGTWYYRVIAVDAAGNPSPSSNEASAVVAGGTVQTVVLSPTEDTYAAQASPNTNLGTSASLNSRGGTSSFTAYLKFTLPTAPAGTTLTGAALSVRTTTDAAAGSVDSYLVSLAPSSWTETTLTWNNRPVVGATVGSFAPPTVPNTRYNAIVEASALSGLPAGPVTLAVSSTSTDNLQFWSQNHAAATYRPTLTLSYQAGGSPVVPDTQAPTAATGLAASVTGQTAALSWTASTDNVGVTGYQVHRSTTSGFTPSPATKIADVTSGTSFSDTGLAGGSYFYQVVAVDAAGNASPSSNEASATVVPADTQVPSAPTGVAATVVNQDVSLSWTASTDNVGVTGYEVHRSATSGFTPSSATKITTVTAGTSFTDTAVTGGTWFYVVVALDAAGNSSVPSAQTTAVVAAPADTQAPTVPTALTAAVSGSAVALTWSASTDNVGVAGYDVHRSATSGFTADATTKIGAVTAGTTYTDVSRPVGTWFYRVIAVDAAGNPSAASAQASAVVSGGAVQTVVLSPTEDTYAAQASPNTNLGTSASMNARGGSSSFTAYLKFTLPSAPAGTTLTGASLSVRTTTDAAAGSADSYVVSLAPSSWSETTLTWANRPAVGAAVGSFAPPTVPNTRYNALVEASALSGLPAGPVTLSVGSVSSTDNLQFWSQNHAATTFRPTLTLTYQAN